MVDRPYLYHRTNKSGLKRPLLLVFMLVLIAASIAYGLVNGKKAGVPPTNQNNAQTAGKTPEKPKYTPIDLQPVVDAWASRQTADYHIVVHDLQAKQDIAVHDPDTVLFAASLYKIYIAYLALLDIQSGAMDPDEIILSGQTRRECIDKMIRSSDSPCGETMMADMGQASLNQRVKDMGMTGTFFNGIRTSAADSAHILKYVAEKRDLDDKNTAFLLDAMRTQDAKFKRGLAAGAPEATWETKVGWNLDINYHDIGIMTMPDGRKFVITILCQGSGSSAPIADFAKTIYESLASN